jgi:phosphoribosylamine---glycine ligase
MNVLVVGAGAREHALAWKLRAGASVGNICVAPGNAGTAALADNLPVGVMDFDAIVAACRERRVDLVVVGPEDPLAAGLVDRLTAEGIRAYGPTAAAARIEASKSFAKQIMARAGIATAEARTFDSTAGALGYVEQWTDRTGLPPVIKADGLAAGKGVTVAATLAEARAAVEAALTGGAFGAAGARVLVEERMTGREVSAHAFCDGAAGIPTVLACDYKRAFDGDAGPNTGGMGVYSPPGFVAPGFEETIRATIVAPLLREMAAAGVPYRGTLYPGLMLTDAGPRVVEFNCRFGDPETQALMPRLDSELAPILAAAAEGRLAGVEVTWKQNAVVGVVLASGGYPGAYRTGLPIDGLDTLDPDVLAFHAGTALDEGGRVVTSGGRVLTVVAEGRTLAEARARVYDNVARIRFEGRHYRTDIALRELEG